MVHNKSESSFVMDVKAKIGLDIIFAELKEPLLKKSVDAFSQGRDGVVRYQGQLCVPNVDNLRQQILAEVHSYRYFIHLGATKMYREFWEIYWWNRMKKDVAVFVAKYPNVIKRKLDIRRWKVYPKTLVFLLENGKI